MDNSKYAFFLDIDGTLWRRGVIPDANKEMISRVRSLGHKVLINTGRSYAFIPKWLFEQIELDGVVSGIGASVRIDGEPIFQKSLSLEDMKYIFNLVKGRNVGMLIEGEERVFLYDENSETKESQDPRITAVIRGWEDWSEEYSDEPIAKITAWEIDLSEQDVISLNERFELVLQIKNRYVEIGNLNCNKATGMLRAIEYLGIDPDHCVAMGDSPNDITMLKAAGISVAMGDGEEAVKDICDIVSTGCEDGGVAEAMKRILKL